jgi:hypothetical protein
MTASLTSQITSQMIGHNMDQGDPYGLASSGCKSLLQSIFKSERQKRPAGCDRRGVETAVFISIEEWRRLQDAARPDWKTVLLKGPRFELPLPNRRKIRLRKPVQFD